MRGANCQNGTVRSQSWYHRLVSTNLRLSAEAADALRAAARQTGRSQQELLREALDQYLGLTQRQSPRERAIASGLVRTPTSFRDPAPAIRLPDGVPSSTALLARDEER